MVDERGEVNIDNTDVRPPELRWQSGRLLTARSSVRSRVEAQCFFPRVGPGCSSRPDTRGKASLHTGGSSAVEQRTVKCASAYAVILWSGVQISPPGYLFFGCIAFQPPVGSRSRRGYCPGANNLSVHSTRVVFIPSKDKIRVRVPMDARLLHGGLLYMVAYNLRKVENRDRYPDPPFASNRRNSLVAGLRVVAAAAWVRFPVSAAFFFWCIADG